MTAEAPSSVAVRHLLPQGEKGSLVHTPNPFTPTVPPSPPVGEGARRADEGAKTRLNPKLLNFARSMRHNPTEAEKRLWVLLRNRRFIEHKFRRQVPIGPYIADFVCYDARLIVEADGSQHAGNYRDLRRDTELRQRGFSMLRFWNNDILARPQTVADAIWNMLQEQAL